MSKKNESGEMENQEAPTEVTAGTFCAIEEHAKTLNVSAPVFAAVRQSKNWAAGKKIEKSDFEKSIKDFLGSPIGGV
jgi:hypothetical protein